MDVIVVDHRIEIVVGHRPKVPVALIDDRGRAIDVLETIDAEAVVGIANQGAMGANGLHMVACGGLVVVVLGARSHGRRHVAPAEQRNQ
jgi:hypothetical protein